MISAFKIGGFGSGAMAALGYLAYAGPWVASIILAFGVIGVLVYKLDTILPAAGRLAILLAIASGIRQGTISPTPEDIAGWTDPVRSISPRVARRPSPKRVQSNLHKAQEAKENDAAPQVK